LDRLEGYLRGVETGEIPSCLHVKNAVNRFRNDFFRTDIVFKKDKVERVLNFISQLRHFTGKHSGNRFILEPWQVFIVANLYGFYYPDGQRRFQTAYIEVARKNGKTALCAALALYHLIADGEDAAQVLMAANSKDQAHICYDMTASFCKGFDPKGDHLRWLRSTILFDRTSSMLKVLASDSDKLDGYNCSFGIVDEYHSAPDSKVRDVLKSSMGMRDNPLLFTITTAGFDKTLPCYALRTVCTEVMAGIKEDDSMFGVIFTLDEEDDWADAENWSKSNPNLGVTVKADFLRKEVVSAKNNPSDEVGVKTKNLNVWCDSFHTWIPDDYIIKATQKLTFDDLAGQDVYVGVDLASVQDMTAVTYLFSKDSRLQFINKYYIPADSLNTRADKDKYKEWVRQGYLTITPGNVTDYNYITKDILDVGRTCLIQVVAYDKWNATQWASDATEQGLPLEPYSQTIGNFNSPTKEMERLIMSEEMGIDDNPITRYCFRNVEMRTDFNGNVKPNKGVDGKKIDGVISAIQALAVYIIRNVDVYSGNIY
jgi:phage terminase large subunit-like protein